MSEQIPLIFGLVEQNTFEYFQTGENQELIQLLKNLDHQEFRQVYLYGPSGSGVTHLLQAACHWFSSQKQSCFYFPLDKAGEYPVEMLQGLESMDLCCLDGVQYIAGDKLWETALFEFYHRTKEAGVKLILSGNNPVRRTGLVLPDLISRIEWGLSYAVSPLSDDEIKTVLLNKAKLRETVLPENTMEYILLNYSRNLSELSRLLDELIHAAWSDKRKLTIPFVKSVIARQR